MTPQFTHFKLLILALLCWPLLLNPIHAKNSANPNKVLRIPLEAADDGFDMVKTANYYSGWVSESIFETLLTYDYMADPVKLIPLTAQAMPEISEDGKTFIFRIKKGIYFTPDAVFKGVKRELTAQDYAYSIKRFLDPANRSPSQNFINGKIIGLNELAEQAKKSGKFDYDAPIEGITTPDRYTLKIKLTHVDYNFLYSLTYSSFGAVAREVVEGYPINLAQHPVGTGPYMLASYTPRSRVVLVANPDWRGFTWDFKSTGTAWDDQVVKEMRGKKMPQIGRVEVSFIEEEQSRWLSFQRKQFDIDWLPQVAASTALDGNNQLTPEFTNEDIALVRMGQAMRAEMMVPPGLVGHDPNYLSSIDYNIPLANKLLDYFGYQRGKDGYRTLPNGQPLEIRFATLPSASYVTLSEIWKRGLDQIGLRSTFPVNSFADGLKAAAECKVMVFSGSWIADFPDGENFYQLLYGPNALRGNYSCYQSEAYDELYRTALSLPLGPERDALYDQMNRQMEADSVMSLQTTRIRNWLIQPEILGFKKHPMLHFTVQYMDIQSKESANKKP